MSDTFRNGQSFYGEPALSTTATTRRVDIDTAPYLNVEWDETVTFVSGGRNFSWTFNGLDWRSVDLRKIAPPGFLDRRWRVYIGRNLLNR